MNITNVSEIIDSSVYLQEEKTTSETPSSIVATNFPPPEMPCFSEDVFEYGYLYSFELRKIQIQKIFEDHLVSPLSNQCMLFLSENGQLLQPLYSLINYLSDIFGNRAGFKLDLFEESQNWQTVFISVYTPFSFEKSDELLDNAYDYLLTNFPNEYQNLNFELLPNAF